MSRLICHPANQANDPLRSRLPAESGLARTNPPLQWVSDSRPFSNRESRPQTMPGTGTRLGTKVILPQAQSGKNVSGHMGCGGRNRCVSSSRLQSQARHCRVVASVDDVTRYTGVVRIPTKERHIRAIPLHRIGRGLIVERLSRRTAGIRPGTAHFGLLGSDMSHSGRAPRSFRPPNWSRSARRLVRTVRYWSAHAQPVICQPELPFFRDIVTMALSVTGLPSLVNDRVVGVTR